MKGNLKVLALLFRANPKYVLGYFFNIILLYLPSYVVNVLFLKVVIDNISDDYNFQKLLTYIIILSSYLILSDLYVSYFSQIFQPYENAKFSAMFLNWIKDSTKKVDLKKYDDPKFFDDYYYITKNICNISDVVMKNFSQVIAQLLNLVLTLVSLHSIGLELVLFAGCSIGITLISNLLFTRLSYNIKNEVTTYKRRRDYFGDLFFRRDCVKERKLSEIDQVLENEYNVSSDAICNIQRKYGIKLAFLDFIREFVPGTLILNFGLLTFLLYKAIVDQSLTNGEFVAAFNGINVVVSSAMTLFETCFSNLRDSEYNIKKFYDFINIPSPQNEENDSLSNQHVSKIELRNVSFAYPGTNVSVLNDINLVLEPKKKIAIVGKNGSGKTTLAYLLMGLYKPQCGKILLDGIPTEVHKSMTFQKSFTSFFQNETPWPATLAENVAFDTTYDKMRVLASLKKAGFCLEEKSNEELLVQQIGKEFDDDGLLLSGGEMQKVMIAHCFYENKPYIVMDEPSSALDPIAELEFNRQIEKISNKSTTIFISHRLTTVKMADYIYVIDEGRVVQQGTHQELLHIDGLYKDMWEIQMKIKKGEV